MAESLDPTNKLNFPTKGFVKNFTDREDAPMISVREKSALPKWLALIVISGALLLVTGAIIALVNPAMLAGGEINDAVHVYAGYLVARNLALALLLIMTLSMSARRPLSTLMVLTAIIQMLDAVMNGFEGRWSLIPGVLVFAVAFLFGAARVTGYPIWTLAAWRDAG